MTPMTTDDGKALGTAAGSRKLTGRSYRESSYGGHVLCDNNTHGSRFNVSRTTGIHDLLHEFWEP